MPNEIGNPNFATSQNYGQYERQESSINPELSLDENIQENLNQFQSNNSRNISDIFAQASVDTTESGAFPNQFTSDTSSSDNKLQNNEYMPYFSSTNATTVTQFDFNTSDLSGRENSINGVCLAQSMIYAKGQLEGRSEEDARPNVTNAANIQDQFQFMFDAVNNQIGTVSLHDRAALFQNTANNLGLNIEDTQKPMHQSSEAVIQDMIDSSRDENGQAKESNFLIVRENTYVTDSGEQLPDSHAMAGNFNPETNEFKFFDPNVGSIGYNMDTNNDLLKAQLFADPTRVSDENGNEYTNYNTNITCYKLDAAPEAKEKDNIFKDALSHFLPPRADTPDLYSRQNQDTSFFG